ncbi:hypothetical protein CALCODRAFT_24519 [Calocera cornea HHB12733]|uniref:Uncharacterized protein n=1 Tax=Calocera cornea HHB12733 TaxID=1353952 RepID=A0A165J1Y9_9BASI|nr:hypothetical protein CALCODRAFT_24519 [Calocera cornea HHB12733]
MKKIVLRFVRHDESCDVSCTVPVSTSRVRVWQSPLRQLFEVGSRYCFGLVTTQSPDKKATILMRWGTFLNGMKTDRVTCPSSLILPDGNVESQNLKNHRGCDSILYWVAFVTTYIQCAALSAFAKQVLAELPLPKIRSVGPTNGTNHSQFVLRMVRTCSRPNAHLGAVI